MYRENSNIIFRIFGGEPIRLRWGAWVTDTHHLRQAGWNFSAHEEHNNYLNCHEVQLIVTSPDKYVVMTGYLRFDPQEIYARNSYHYGDFKSYDHIELQQFTANSVFRTESVQNIHRWEMATPIDIRAETFMHERDWRMRDFKFFKQLDEPVQEPQKEIYIPNESVDDLFNKILQIQYPEQQEIKKKLILPESKPIIQAKIFSLAV